MKYKVYEICRKDDKEWITQKAEEIAEKVIEECGGKVLKKLGVEFDEFKQRVFELLDALYIDEIYIPYDIKHDDLTRVFIPYKTLRIGQKTAFYNLNYLLRKDYCDEDLVWLCGRTGSGKTAVYIGSLLALRLEGYTKQIILTPRNKLQEDIVSSFHKVWKNTVFDNDMKWGDIVDFTLLQAKEKMCKLDRCICKELLPVFEKSEVIGFTDGRRFIEKCEDCPYEIEKDKIVKRFDKIVPVLNQGFLYFATNELPGVDVVVIDEPEEIFKPENFMITVDKYPFLNIDYKNLSEIKSYISDLIKHFHEKYLEAQDREKISEMRKFYIKLLDLYNTSKKIDLLMKIEQNLDKNEKIHFIEGEEKLTVFPVARIETFAKALFEDAKIVLVSATPQCYKGKVVEMKPVKFSQRIIYFPVCNLAKTAVKKDKRLIKLAAVLAIYTMDFLKDEVLACIYSSLINDDEKVKLLDKIFEGIIGEVKYPKEDEENVTLLRMQEFENNVLFRPKIIIHTGNTDLHGYVTEKVLREIKGRDKVVEYRIGRQKETLDEFLNSNAEYMTAVCMEYGYNLDKVLAQVILKVPYLPLDFVVKEYMKAFGNEWYEKNALNKVIQVCGRNARKPIHVRWCIILDSKFGELYKKYENEVPKWFKEQLIMLKGFS